MREFILVLMTVTAVGSTEASRPTSSSHLQQLSVAGIHIDDAPVTVFNALRHDGYVVVKVSRSKSFRQRLSDALNTELQRPTERTQLTDIASVQATIGDQRITVAFDDDAKGSRVGSSVHYEASSVARPFGVVRRKLIERYGPPEASDGTGSVWCDVDPPPVCLAAGTRGSRLKVGYDYRGFNPNAKLTTIELRVGTEVRDQWAAGFKAALARLMKSGDAF